MSRPEFVNLSKGMCRIKVSSGKKRAVLSRIEGVRVFNSLGEKLVFFPEWMKDSISQILWPRRKKRIKKDNQLSIIAD